MYGGPYFIGHTYAGNGWGMAKPECIKASAALSFVTRYKSRDDANYMATCITMIVKCYSCRNLFQMNFSRTANTSILKQTHNAHNHTQNNFIWLDFLL